MQHAPQLIAYADRFGGSLRALADLLEGPLSGVFSGVHVLPFFHRIDGADAGFDPIDHTRVDTRLGTWEDVAALGRKLDVMADLVVNHVSADSAQFRDFLELGDASPYAGMFLSQERVFPEGASSELLARIYRPRPGAPFTTVTLPDGRRRSMWTTFSSAQIDVDVRDPATSAYFDEILDRFHAAGIRAIRLDAVGYAVKTAGTSCFLTPETLAYVGELAQRCRSRGFEVLAEVHGHHELQAAVADRVDWVYDFALPPLVLHGLTTGDGGPLKRWLRLRPDNSITVLDTHDGIGVVDVAAGNEGAGLLDEAEIDQLVEGIHIRSGGQSRLATGAAASNLDLYQVNCSFYDALGADDRRYWLARAIQLFVPGIPQIYYVGLLAGQNDMALLQRTGVGRDINRRYFSRPEIERELRRPVVAQLVELIRFRNRHPAFSGDWVLHDTPDRLLRLSWRNGEHRAELTVDLVDAGFELVHASDSALTVVDDPGHLGGGGD